MSTDAPTFENTFIYHGPMAARMACNLGDLKASVLCNILGDQPLFYIDYVDAEENDFIDPMALLEGDAGSEFYPENIEQLRRRMARLEGASQHIDGYARENAEAAFDAAVAGISKAVSLDDILPLLLQSRLAASFYEDTKPRGLTFHLNAQIDTAVYDRDQIAIHINPRLSAPLAVLAASRALRQAWLHLKGTAIHPLHFAPEEAVLLNRIQHADLACTIVRTAWELNLSGQKDAWGRILTGSAYDLAVGFAREAIADFRALNNGQAAHATFERWFFSGRCKDIDRKLIQQMLADHHGLVFEHPQVSKMVTNDIIARTGELPVGRNYLNGLIETVLSDPLFTEVRDRSNANFLWFIKFERSFRATEGGMEQNLQGVAQIPSGASQNKASDGQPASVVSFTGSTRKRKAGGSKAAMGADMATVYYIDHFLSLSNR
jgi:hypothetical protein